jgi:TolB protein
VSQRDEDFEIYMLDLRNGHEIRLTNSPKQDCYPDWSPDGKWIAFTTLRDGNLEIYLMNANGEQLTRLTDNNVDDAISRWSPDGSQIAYQFESETGNWVLAMMDADGKNQRLIMPGLSWDTEPAWAPADYNSVSVNLSGKYRVTWGEIK